MSLASKVLVGLVLGIATGIALGEWAGALAVVGRGFILLLQMAVLPFVVVSLIGGLGRLDARQAIAIARSGGLVLLLLWAIVMAVVLAFPVAFPDWESASFFSHAMVAIAAGGYYERLVGSLLPHARVVRVASPRSYFLGEAPESDALVTAAEAGSAWTLVYPRFAVAVPQPDPIAVPLAYPMPHGEAALADTVDAFVALKRKDGTVRELAAYWFEGKGRAADSPRWSLIRDVLGWGESGSQLGAGS
jgi:hypothetical protein